VSDESLAITLGCTVTELKAWLEPQQVADEDIAADLRRAPEDAVWSVHGMSRIAWSTLPGRTIVFANGRWRHVDEQALPLMQGICRDRGLPIGELRMASDGSLLQWLLLTGVFASPHFE
jgi:hypothetical protein